MKKPWIKWCALVIGALAAIVGVPIIINECYKANSGYMTIWGAADVLSYYGTILGTLVTVVTIVVTISFTRKQIQRESYLKNESDKWANIEAIISDALDKINPRRILMANINDTVVDNNFPDALLITIQKYQLDCRIATDQLFSYLSSEDFPKVKNLLDQIMQASNSFSTICEKEIKAYRGIKDLKARRTALETTELEKKYPNSFSTGVLVYCTEVLERTKDLKYDDIWNDIGSSNGEMAAAYEQVYRNLLALKGQTFDAIYTSIRKEANEILRFGGKR